jgi:hypothetical protein
MQAVLKAQINKTDRNDARGIAHNNHHDVAKFHGLRNRSGAGQRTELIYEPLQCIGMAGRKHHGMPRLNEERT